MDRSFFELPSNGLSDRDWKRPEAEYEDEEREPGDEAAGGTEGIHRVGFRMRNAEHHA